MFQVGRGRAKTRRCCRRDTVASRLFTPTNRQTDRRTRVANEPPPPAHTHTHARINRDACYVKQLDSTKPSGRPAARRERRVSLIKRLISTRAHMNIQKPNFQGGKKKELDNFATTTRPNSGQPLVLKLWCASRCIPRTGQCLSGGAYRRCYIPLLVKPILPMTKGTRKEEETATRRNFKSAITPGEVVSKAPQSFWRRAGTVST